MPDVEIEFRGAAAQMLKMRDPEVMLSGAFGTGKTVAILHKFHWGLTKYPGSRCLALRKRHTDLAASILQTFRERVLLPEDIDQGEVKYFGGSGEKPPGYRYKNGSELVVAGMNRDTKALGADYDWIYPAEAIEFTEHEYETLSGRCRHYAIPYQQVIGDTNPGPPTHWILSRAARGQLKLLYSQHIDNPFLWDGEKWTERGEQYMTRLEGMTGVRRERYYEGKWVSAEGTVYTFNRAQGLIDPFPIPDDWERFRSIDFGFVNPFCCQWWAVDHDGRMFLYREIYFSQRTVNKHAELINALSKGERISYTVCDHDAEDRATLHEHGIPTIPARKDIKIGIQKVEERIDTNGGRTMRLFMFNNCTVELDEELVENGLPTCTNQEWDVYSWPKDMANKPVKEVPVDRDNHGMDTLRYAVMSQERRRPSGQLVSRVTKDSIYKDI